MDNKKAIKKPIVQDAPICHAVNISRNVIEYAVLPILAILICIYFDKLKGKSNIEN